MTARPPTCNTLFCSPIMSTVSVQRLGCGLLGSSGNVRNAISTTQPSRWATRIHMLGGCKPTRDRRSVACVPLLLVQTARSFEEWCVGWAAALSLRWVVSVAFLLMPVAREVGAEASANC